MPKSKSLSRKSWLGPPPLVEGENENDYNKLLAKVSNDLQPSDTIEVIYIRDFVDLTWEIFCWRRIKTSLVTNELPDALASVLERITGAGRYSDCMKALVKSWVANEPSAIKEVNKYLTSANMTFDTVINEAFSHNLGDTEKIEHLTTIAESRRNAAMREL